MRLSALAVAAAVAALAVNGSVRPSPAFVAESITFIGPPPLHGVARRTVDWCGAGQAAVVNRKPENDLSSDRNVHVTYVVPADSPSRFAERTDAIATDVAAIDGWWRGQDASRTLRFDRYPFPGCTTKFGALDIGFIRLARPGNTYVGEDGLDELRRDLMPLADLPWHKHLVYYDGPNLFDESVCGTTSTSRQTRALGGLDGLSFVWLSSLCAGDLGASGLIASVAVHELIHSLGALSEGSPHACADRAHVCDSAFDILTPFATTETTLATQVLDVNGDDYYGAPFPPWFDIQLLSGWLSHLPQLPVRLSADGSAGTIEMTSPVAFECGRSCSFEVDTGAKLTFVATPGASARLVGWSGACAGVGACTVTVDQETTVAAVFGPAAVRVSISVRGKGRVVSTPAGITCPGRCSATFPPGTKLRLRATPAAGWRFASWSGSCRGRGPCVVTAYRVRKVRATFVRR